MTLLSKTALPKASTAFRSLSNLRWAARVEPRAMPNPVSTWSKVGLAYERKVVKQLKSLSLPVLHNPAFEYEDDNGLGYCVPDILISPTTITNYKLVIIECKLTFKADAILKARALYAPVISLALNFPYPVSVVIVKNVTPFSPPPVFTLGAALCQEEAEVMREAANPYLIQWLGRGTFPIQ